MESADEMKTGVADLHLHTTASDGRSTVEERLRQAADRGLDAVAITDHDCLPADLSCRVETRDGVELVAGVEVRADVQGTKIELLGYYVDPDDDRLSDVLERTREYRRQRNRRLVSNLNDLTNADLSYQRLASETDGMVGRPHLADALVDADVVGSVGEAFADYLGNDSDAFVPMERIHHAEVIEAIHDSGGVASLAHPGRIRASSVDQLVAELVDAGIDGIEVWYPYDESYSAAYADVGIEDAATLADRHGLLATGGSDCHGPKSGKFRIGSVTVPAEAFRRLRRAANERRTLPDAGSWPGGTRCHGAGGER